MAPMRALVLAGSLAVALLALAPVAAALPSPIPLPVDPPGSGCGVESAPNGFVGLEVRYCLFDPSVEGFVCTNLTQTAPFWPFPDYCVFF